MELNQIMVFFSICPRSRKYLDYSIGDIPLRVVRDKGVDRKPDVDVDFSCFLCISYQS